jgi:hypothetical protein
MGRYNLLRPHLLVWAVIVLVIANSIIISNVIGDRVNFTVSEINIDDKDNDNDGTMDSNSKDLISCGRRGFTENRGQLTNDEVLFYDQGGNVWFTADGVWFELREEIKIPESRVSSLESPELQTHTLTHTQTHPQKYKRIILKQEFVGANAVKPVGQERLSWDSNFFFGKNPDEWRTNVPSYQEIFYENLYDGIDLRYYNTQSGLKYDLIVHPGAEVNQIKIQYYGIEDLTIDGSGNR